MDLPCGRGVIRVTRTLADAFPLLMPAKHRFGLGKAEEDSIYTAEENITRVKLASEAQLEETEEEAQARMVRQLIPVPTLPIT